MINDIEKKVDSKLTKFNALSYKDKAFVRSVVIGEISKIEIAKQVYGIENDIDADIKSMTTLSRLDIQEALAELNLLQGVLLKSRILNMSDKALDKVSHIMESGAEESNRLKAASTIAKMGVDLVKESEKNTPGVAMKIIIENPSGDIKINFDKDKIMESFANKEEVEIIEGEFEEVVDHEEKSTAVTSEVAVEEKTVDQEDKKFHKNVEVMIDVMEKVNKALEPKEDKPKSLFEELTDKEKTRNEDKVKMEF